MFRVLYKRSLNETRWCSRVFVSEKEAKDLASKVFFPFIQPATDPIPETYRNHSDLKTKYKLTLFAQDPKWLAGKVGA